MGLGGVGVKKLWAALRGRMKRVARRATMVGRGGGPEAPIRGGVGRGARVAAMAKLTLKAILIR